ncbi:Lactonase, 7-bladed beta-propeller-domain-containing protein [Boletus reticuloceps]|uniref:Lactonase, 7-bladed beta-propeller-domain-containing protein n=1 Tax=Boletus reticuloceps TaxID=495285 RepID=A0A8I2Z088_9AGAM|nr:Lactonase, 7-bladed beta-propeller-domain-containing protein [Boletus reticuloceps]
MATYKILVGSYTDSIYTLNFAPAPSGGTPTLTLLSQVHVGHHPSWIEAHPSDRSLIFAGLEQADGQIVVLKYDKDGKGHKVDEATCPSGGADPCTLLLTENEVIVGNYSGGTVATIPISTSPPYTRPAELWTLAMPFEDGKPGRDLSRQEASHPHQTAFNPLNTTEKELLVPDLGSDKVWQLTKGSDGHWAIRGFISAETGGGPRHVAIYGACAHCGPFPCEADNNGKGNVLYVLLELTSQLAVYRFHSGLPTTHLTTLSTLEQSPAPSYMKAAEILIPKPNRSFPWCISISRIGRTHTPRATRSPFSPWKRERNIQNSWAKYARG